MIGRTKTLSRSIKSYGTTNLQLIIMGKVVQTMALSCLLLYIENKEIT